MSLHNYIKYINPQNRILLDEYNKANQNEMWLTSIILSLTIIDNVLSDENNLNYIDGLDINHFKSSKINCEIINYKNKTYNPIINNIPPIGTTVFVATERVM